MNNEKGQANLAYALANWTCARKQGDGFVVLPSAEDPSTVDCRTRVS
jgi:hypothetical protein